MTQDRLPLDLPAPDFDTRGYTPAQIAAAQRTLEQTDALLERHPELYKIAEGIVRESATVGGYVGVRLLGERLRAHLSDSGTEDTFSNDLIPAMTRRFIQSAPWLAAYLDVKPATVDVLIGIGGVDHG